MASGCGFRQWQPRAWGCVDRSQCCPGEPCPHLSTKQVTASQSTRQASLGCILRMETSYKISLEQKVTSPQMFETLYARPPAAGKIIQAPERLMAHEHCPGIRTWFPTRHLAIWHCLLAMRPWACVTCVL